MDQAPAKRRIKWEPGALMVLVVGLGIWLVLMTPGDVPRSPDKTYATLRVGPLRGYVEISPPNPAAPPETDARFRLLYRGDEASEPMTAPQMQALVGERGLDKLLAQADNVWFRLFNITSWTSFGWILLGFGAQAVFMSRMLIQWIVSERRRESVVPAAFWYLSFAGGAMLFAYFAWRQDIVAVMGQTTGIVIYARNIRLIWKQRRRERRRTEEESAG